MKQIEKDILLHFDDFMYLYEKSYSEFEQFDKVKLNSKCFDIIGKLKKRLLKSYPFFHPFYAGQMLRPPHPIAAHSYLLAMMVNSNNHALDGGPETSLMEKEVIEKIASMFKLEKYIGHLTSGGTIANLEALWISKQIYPDNSIAICENAHYTHSRLSNVLNFDFDLINQNKFGKIDVEDLEDKLKQNKIRTVVLTLGTTGFGALDEVHSVYKLKEKYEFRIHIDAAYGGFYKIFQNFNDGLVDNLPYSLVNKCDSIVIDPHKHGLQPYGCGCVLFSDPNVCKYYKHDSPYTYFISDELHLGEISLECSRAGASAAALWATLNLLPLDLKNGFFPILQNCRKAAIEFYNLCEKSNIIRPFIYPELDIVNYFINDKTTSEISKKNRMIFEKLMKRKEKRIYLSLNRVNTNFFKMNIPNVEVNSDEVVLLRSVFMKPEHKKYVKEIFNEIMIEVKKQF